MIFLIAENTFLLSGVHTHAVVFRSRLLNYCPHCQIKEEVAQLIGKAQAAP